MVASKTTEREGLMKKYNDDRVLLKTDVEFLRAEFAQVLSFLQFVQFSIWIHLEDMNW